MSEYSVVFTTSASYFAIVEADSAEEAEEKAWELGTPQACHQEEFELSGDWDIEGVYKQ